MPASSFVSKPTSTFGFACRGSLRKTASRVAGFNFAAHPAALGIDVNFKAEATHHLEPKPQTWIAKLRRRTASQPFYHESLLQQHGSFVNFFDGHRAGIEVSCTCVVNVFSCACERATKSAQLRQEPHPPCPQLLLLQSPPSGRRSANFRLTWMRNK